LILQASIEAHQGHGCAVLLVIIVKGVVPPGSVFFLKGHEDGCKVVLVQRLIYFGEGFDAKGGIIVSIVEEIAGNREP
jgi:hypothetical protein